MITFLLLLASQLADALTTYAAGTMYPAYVMESNPMMRQFISIGWVPTIAMKIGVAAFCALMLRFIRPGKIVHAAFVGAYMLAGIVPAINNAYILWLLTRAVNG